MPDFDDREGDGDEGEEYREGSPSHQFCDVVNLSIYVGKTVVNLEPELEIWLHRGLNDEGESHWERKIDFKKKSGNKSKLGGEYCETY